MPKRRRRSHVPVPLGPRPRRDRPPHRWATREFYATAGVVGLLVVAVGIVAFAFISNYIEDRNRPDSTAVKVEDTNYTVAYFTDRLNHFIQQSGGSGSDSDSNRRPHCPSLPDELIDEALLLGFARNRGSPQPTTKSRRKSPSCSRSRARTTPRSTLASRKSSAASISPRAVSGHGPAAVLTTQGRREVHGRGAGRRRIHPLPRDHPRLTRPRETRSWPADRRRRRLRAGRSREVHGHRRQGERRRRRLGATWLPGDELEDALFALEPSKLTTFETNGQCLRLPGAREAGRPAGRRSAEDHNLQTNPIGGSRKNALVAIKNDLSAGDCDEEGQVGSRSRVRA